ncbi:MAG TPA: hypothetical protein G4O08_11240 [Anaerolineae bacterium]|nr:hypothetical protein [Anaerolineae bacterium]
MNKKKAVAFPRWMFGVLAIGGAWASGIYLGKITADGYSIESLIPTLAFGIMSLLMTWGTLAKR